MASHENFEISGENKLHNKITAIKNLAKSYELRLRGFRWDTSNEKWIIAGKALAGSNFINQSTGIITSFAEPVNLITTKTIEKYYVEFQDAFYRINTMMVNDMSIPQENYRAIIKMFKDTMSNIGDIITGSKKVVEKVFNNLEMIDEQQNNYE